MKNLILLLISSSILMVVACKRTEIVTKPRDANNENLPKQDTIIKFSLKPLPTKEPYILLEDEGFEAELIAQGIDTDDQINGKIAAEDVEKTTSFGWPLKLIVNSDEYLFFKPLLNRYFEATGLLATNYKTKTGKELIIKKIADIQKFKNLKSLYINFINEPIDTLSLVMNTKLEKFEVANCQIKVINFNGCKQIKKINFRYSLHPSNATLLDNIYISECKDLEELSYNGDPRTLDVSKNIALKYIEVAYKGGTNSYKIEKLQLCNNLKLESLFIYIYNFESIYLPKNFYLKYEENKNINDTNGFSILRNLGIPIKICE